VSVTRPLKPNEKAKEPDRLSPIRLAARAPRRIAKTAARSALYRGWPATSVTTDGYTLVAPLPGDLPVFLELVLAGLQKQDPDRHVETIVIPDRLTPEFAATFARATARVDRPVRLAQIDRRGYALQRARNGPWNQSCAVLNYFLQVYHGIAAARSTHAILHDADLFLTDQRFLAKRYERCAEHGLGWLGVERRYDDFYERNGLGPVSATWELTFEVASVRRFPPWQLGGQTRRWGDVEKDFDVTDYVQVLTPTERRAVWEEPDGYVHFNWGIAHYRLFQEAGAGSFTDGYFLILLMRVLSDAFGQIDASDHLPPLEDLVRGITDPAARVNYRASGLEERYARFRRQIGRVIESPAVEPPQADKIERALRPFDAAFA
jgi:hypothetical protein